MRVGPGGGRLVILGHTFRFPNGMGGSARVANYATGLRRQGLEVTVLCLKPLEPKCGPVVNPAPRGSIEGADYVHTSGTTVYCERSLLRWIQNLLGLWGAVTYLRAVRRSEQIIGILYYGMGYSITYALFAWLLSRWAQVPLIAEATEQPFVYESNSPMTRLRTAVFWHGVVKLPDAIVVISQHLRKRFRASARAFAPVVLVPVMVDLDRFRGPGTSVSRVVVYCGSLDHAGEIDLLLETWSRVWPDFNEHRLRIVGEGNPARTKELLGMVASLGIQDCVEFTGLVARDAIPGILHESAVLVLPRPSNLFSLAGLPNKLGEYLASARPVLCTAVGDIPEYLHDGHSAFLVPPGRQDSLEAALRSILANPSLAAEVGQRGRDVAQRLFGLDVNCKRIVDLLHDLEHSR